MGARKARLTNKVQRLKTIEAQYNEGRRWLSEDAKESRGTNNQAAISSTPTTPIAEVEFLKYGVRPSSTLVNTSSN